MAEFPPNLDDGELYLPSDIFINENHFSCMDDLAHHFSLLQPHQTPSKTAPNYELFKQPVQSGSVNPLRLPEYYRVNGGVELGQRLYGSSIPGSDPFYEYQFVEPTQTQVDRYLETRARVLQQQRQKLQLQNRLLQNRGLPFQANSGFGLGSGFVRESAGTGVFHPRIANPSSTTTAAAAANSVTEPKRKQGVRMRQVSQATQQSNFITRARASVNKHKDCYYHLPPEMGLPRDWTY